MGIIGYDVSKPSYPAVSQPVETKLLHTHVCGSSGQGKSNFLEHLIRQDMEAGYGVGVIDPHGDLTEKVLSLVPPHRMDDVLYFDVRDFERPIGFNPFSDVAPDDMPRVADGVIYALRSIWGDTWGSSRMQFLIKNSVLPLLEQGGHTLLGIERFVSDSDFRQPVLDDTKNPAVVKYWAEVFAEYKAQDQQQMVAPIHHHLGQFASDFAIRNIIGQPTDKLRLKERMDNKQIIIANLSKGHIGQVNSNFIGSLLVSFFGLSAMQRTDNRTPFFLYVDEFQNFATDSFADILSEARKYGLGLTLAHQYFDQLSTEVKEAVFGNCATLISFRVGMKDGHVLEKSTDFPINAFTELPRYEARVVMDTAEYRIRTKPPQDGSDTHSLRSKSRMRYGTPRKEIEARLRRFYR